MAKNRNLILIIVAVVIVLGLGIYGAFYYASKRSAQNTAKSLISITKEETTGNYIPAAISDVFSYLSSKGVTSTVRDLSNQRQQYVSTIQTSNLAQTFNQLKSQLTRNGYFIYGENDKNYLLMASKSTELIQVMAQPNSSDTLVVSVYK